MAPDTDATAGTPKGWHDLKAVLAEEPVATLLAAYLAVAARLRIRFLWLPKQAPELSPMDQLWCELKRLIAANRQAESIDALANDAAAWVLTLTPQQARRKAGMTSKRFWLKSLLQHFWPPTQHAPDLPLLRRRHPRPRLLLLSRPGAAEGAARALPGRRLHAGMGRRAARPRPAAAGGGDPGRQDLEAPHRRRGDRLGPAAGLRYRHPTADPRHPAASASRGQPTRCTEGPGSTPAWCHAPLISRFLQARSATCKIEVLKLGLMRRSAWYTRRRMAFRKTPSPGSSPLRCISRTAMSSVVKDLPSASRNTSWHARLNSRQVKCGHRLRGAKARTDGTRARSCASTSARTAR